MKVYYCPDEQFTIIYDCAVDVDDELIYIGFLSSYMLESCNYNVPDNVSDFRTLVWNSGYVGGSIASRTDEIIGEVISQNNKDLLNGL